MDQRLFKEIPIIEIALRLGLAVKGTKSMCFGQHDKQTPSLSFNVRENYWHCFGCGKGGNGIELVKQVLDTDFMGAIRWLQQEVLNCHMPASFPRRFRIDLDMSARGRQEGEFQPDPELFLSLMNACPQVNSTSGMAYLNAHG